MEQAFDFTLDIYDEHVIGVGSASKAVAYVSIERKLGRRCFGAGVDANISIASKNKRGIPMGAKILVLTSIFLMLAATMVVAAGDEELEKHAVAIEGKLMAPCCWSSTISQHYSTTADEIRRDIRNMLNAGKSEREILDHYVSIYGERILASPSARGFNLLAWLFPGIFFVTCAAYVVLLLHRWTLSRSAQITADSPGQPLDESYMRRLEKELREFE